MDWESHDEWAERFGISRDVSHYVNRVVDNPPGLELPEDYRKSISKSVKRRLHGEDLSHSKQTVMSIITAPEVRDHDSARSPRTIRKVAADAQLTFLGDKGDDYVSAWYLHHQLDYLCDQWTSETSVSELVFRHSSDRPETFSDEIGQFLLAHRERLADELAQECS